MIIIMITRMMTNDHNNDYKEEDNDHDNDYKEDDNDHNNDYKEDDNDHNNDYKEEDNDHNNDYKDEDDKNNHHDYDKDDHDDDKDYIMLKINNMIIEFREWRYHEELLMLTIALRHNKRLKKETLFMWIMKELLR